MGTLRHHVPQQLFLLRQLLFRSAFPPHLRDFRRQRGRHPLHVFEVRLADSDVILIEPLERIVREVGQPCVTLAVQSRRYAQFILINAPRNAGIFQAFRKRLPTRIRAVVHIGVPYIRRGSRIRLFADRSRPQVQPVRRGSGESRTEMLIANRECVGEAVVERKIRAIVVAHGQRHARAFLAIRTLRIEPAVVVPVIAGVRLVAPGVRQRSQPGRFAALEIQPEGRIGFSRLIGLQPHGLLVGQRDCTRIVEAAHSAQRSKRMIERAVLLHQDHHVLGVEKRTSFRRIDLRSSLDRCHQRAHTGRAPCEGGGMAKEVSSSAHLGNYLPYE